MEWVKNIVVFILFGVGIFVCIIAAALILHSQNDNSQVKSFENEILIKATALDTYNFVLDPEKVGKWWGNVDEVVYLTSGLPSKNTKYVLVTNNGDIDVVIKSINKGKSVELTLVYKNTENIGTKSFVFSEQNENTILTVKSSVRYLRDNERFWSPITNYQLTQSTQKDLEMLKRLVENK
jgi:hypothetical protein